MGRTGIFSERMELGRPSTFSVWSQLCHTWDSGFDLTQRASSLFLGPALNRGICMCCVRFSFFMEGLLVVVGVFVVYRVGRVVTDRTYSTAVIAVSTAVWMSSVVVNRTRLNRMDSKTAFRDKPIASSTVEGSIDPAMQALPVATATGSVCTTTGASWE